MATADAPPGSLRKVAEDRGYSSLGDVLAVAPQLAKARKAETLADAVRKAVEANRLVLASARGARFRSVAWGFVVALRDRAELADLNGVEAHEIVGPLLDPEGGWSALGESDSSGREDNPAAAFKALWGSINSSSPIRAARCRADARPVEIPDLSGRGLDDLRRFASTIAHLAAEKPGEPLFIAGHAFAEALGASPRSVYYWRRTLAALGLLVELRPADRKHRRAAEYRWTGPLPEGEGVE